MKRFITKALLAPLCVLSCINFCYADEIVPVSTTNKTPQLVAPVVKENKNGTLDTSKPIDLNAIILDTQAQAQEFDSNANIEGLNAEDDADEPTISEQMKFNLHEALHGRVETPSTKGLLEDRMRMTFKKGAIESIAPWVDFNGMFSNIWSGDPYTNTLFGINFADVGINGKMRDGKTTFRVMLNVGKEIVGNTYMQSMPADIFVIRQMDKHNKLFLGYARSPIGLEGGESPLTIPFFTRSQISRTYGNVRTLGTKVMGDYALVDYNIGVSSSGRYFRDFFPGPEFTSWVNLKPLGKTDGRYGKLAVGGGINAGNAESHYVVGGAAVNYEYKRLKATVEYASADGSNGSTGFTAAQSEGYYGTLAYRITPKLQALVRYDKFDPNKITKNDMRTEYTAGINYFIRGQALKLMLNYVYYTVENGLCGNKIMFGTQIIL